MCHTVQQGRGQAVVTWTWITDKGRQPAKWSEGDASCRQLRKTSSREHHWARSAVQQMVTWFKGFTQHPANCGFIFKLSTLHLAPTAHDAHRGKCSTQCSTAESHSSCRLPNSLIVLGR